MEEEVYEVRKDTFLAGMPTESRQRTDIWRTQETKLAGKEKIIDGVDNVREL